MVPLQFHQYKNQPSMKRRIEELRAELREANLADLAGRTGAAYHQSTGEMGIPLFGKRLIITPELMVLEEKSREKAGLNTQALLLYHLTCSDGVLVTGRWISFRELPDGGFYHQAFQGYTGHQLAKTFQNDIGGLKSAALSLGGRPEAMGDLAFSFRALPRVPVALIYWLGDEDFPASARILFDASAGHHLPTDACALLGSTLTRRLIPQKPAR